MDALIRWEPGFMAAVQEFLGEKLCTILGYFGVFGESMLILVAALFIYFVVDKKKGRVFGLIMVSGTVFNALIKNIFVRVRPYADHPEVKCFRPAAEGDLYDMNIQGYSFPSGHSTNAASGLGGAAYLFRKKWLIATAVILSVLTAVSRVIVGCHYPTDVLVGLALGAGIAIGVGALSKKIEKEWIMALILSLCTIPGWFYCTSDDFFTGAGMAYGLLFAILFEERFVRFKNTDNILRGVLRILGGAVIYLVMDAVLKLPFPESVRNAGDFAAHLIRAGRYTIILFLICGVYPMVFRIWDRAEIKKHPEMNDESAGK